MIFSEKNMEGAEKVDKKSIDKLSSQRLICHFSRICKMCCLAPVRLSE